MRDSAVTLPVATGALIALALVARAQYVPMSPCPDLFSYENGQPVYGMIRYRPAGGMSSVSLRANFSVKAALPTSYLGSLEVLGQKQSVLQSMLRGEPLFYRVNFPVTSPVPKLSAITVNGNILCVGEAEFAGPGEAVTSISLNHMLYSDGEPGPPYFIQPTETQQTFNQQSQSQASFNQPSQSYPSLNRPGQPQPAINQPSQSQSGFNQPGQTQPIFNHPSQSQPIFTGSFTNRNPTIVVDGQKFEINSDNFNLEDSKEPSFAINTITVSNDKTPQAVVNQVFPGSNGQQSNVQLKPSPQIPPQRPPEQTPQIVPPEPTAPAKPVPSPPAPVPSPPAPVPSPPAPVPSQPSPRPISPIECGVVSGGNDRVALVYQGASVSRGDWPWLTAIYVKRGGGVQYICTGSLISNQHVITAAHCAHEKSSLLARSVFVVKTGAHNLDSWSDAVIRGLSASYVHPDYNAATLENDILLMKLDSAVQFTTFNSPVCLWEGATDEAFVAGQYGTVVGWGLNEIRGSGQGEPRMAAVPIVSTETCRASRIEFHKLTSKNTLCAGDRNGTGPCNGDSGGGLYILWGGRWRLRGVVSVALRPVTGEAKCNLDEYVVFTDVAQYLPWIKENMD